MFASIQKYSSTSNRHDRSRALDIPRTPQLPFHYFFTLTAPIVKTIVDLLSSRSGFGAVQLESSP